MRQILHQLRQKPEHYRKGIALAVSGAFTLMLVIVWGVTLPVRFAALSAKADSQTAAVAASPLETLKNTLNQNVSNLKSQINTSSNSNVFTSTSSDQYSDYVSNGVQISPTGSDTSLDSSSDDQSQVSPFTGE